MRQQELPDGRVEREAVGTLPRGVHQHRARAVDHVAGGYLTAPRLEHVLHLAACAAGDLLVHREDGANGHVDVDVRRSIEGIEQQHILAGAESLGNVDDVRLLFGRHGTQPATMIECLDDDFVGNHVELLLHLPLDVHVAGRAENVRESGTSHFVRDHLAGERHVIEDTGQFAGGLGEHAFLLDDETFDRDDGGRSMPDHGSTPGGRRARRSAAAFDPDPADRRETHGRTVRALAANAERASAIVQTGVRGDGEARAERAPAQSISVVRRIVRRFASGRPAPPRRATGRSW